MQRLAVHVYIAFHVQIAYVQRAHLRVQVDECRVQEHRKDAPCQVGQHQQACQRLDCIESWDHQRQGCNNACTVSHTMTSPTDLQAIRFGSGDQQVIAHRFALSNISPIRSAGKTQQPLIATFLIQSLVSLLPVHFENANCLCRQPSHTSHEKNRL